VAHAAADVEDVADALGINRFAVAGRSGGGPHALACAALLPERVTRVAVLVSLAPRDAEGLDWYAGMISSNIASYTSAERGIAAFAELIEPHVAEIRADPAAHLPFLMTDLPASDRRVLADLGIRTMLASNFAEAFKTSSAGWIDDVLAFISPWGFDPAAITVPLQLWHGDEDVFIPVSHALWLAERISTAKLTIKGGAAHFGAVRVMPEMLRDLVAVPETDAA
jgi:pimeloyl-ACP methyl ester carboxylesterase